jgi:hypothetical protein
MTTVNVNKKRLGNYFKIYEQIYENPFVSQSTITKKTNILRSSVSRYLEEMYQFSILQGPLICVKPAHTYSPHVYFCHFTNPVVTYENLETCPHLLSRSLNCGSWNITLICDTAVNLSLFKDFQTCILEGAKSVTYLSRVTSLTWKESMRKMQRVTSPVEKTTLHEEIAHNPWGKKEWQLFHAFRYNAQMGAESVLKKLKIRYNTFKNWKSDLHLYAHVYPAFYPAGLKNYFISDYLFESLYHTQLTDVLGLLPSTSQFFSVNKYLLARLLILTRKQEEDLFSLLFQLKQKGFFTDFHYTRVIATSHCNNTFK